MVSWGPKEKKLARTGIHATTVAVERSTIRLGVCGSYTAPSIASLRSSTIRGGDNISGDVQRRAAGRGHRTAWIGVNRSLVVRIVVDACHYSSVLHVT